MNGRIVESKDRMKTISCVMLLVSIILVFGVMFELVSMSSHTIFFLLLPYLGFMLGLFVILVIDLLGRKLPKIKIVLEDSIFWDGLWRILLQEND